MSNATAPRDIGARLDRLERQLDAVSAALVSGDGPSLQSASSLLRDAAVDFAALLPVPVAAVREAGEPLQRRLGAAAQRFSSCRDNLARRAAVVDRALGSLLPRANAGAATYGRAAGQPASRFF